MRRKFILALLSLPFVNKLVADQFDSGESKPLPDLPIDVGTAYALTSQKNSYDGAYYMTLHTLDGSIHNFRSMTPIEHRRVTAKELRDLKSRMHGRNYGMNFHSQEK